MNVEIKGVVKRDEPLSIHTSIRTGGKADLFVAPIDMNELLRVMRTVKDDLLPYLVIGEGTNLLISDDGFRGLVIKLGREFEGIRIDGERVYAGAALKLGKLIHECVNNSLSGLEYLYGIPGTVGGAACTNAGAYGRHFSDFIQSVKGINGEGNSVSFHRNEIEFEYRKAVYPRKIVIIEVELKLTTGSVSEALRVMEDCLEKRRATQPLGELTAGCIFKNPAPNLPAGKLIEECGLKGKSIGDAMVSSKHANFIVNKGKATTAQILTLINFIIDQVRRKKGIELCPEVEVVG